MSIDGTKSMSNTTGSVNNGGTSQSPLTLPTGTTLDSAGTTIHYPNHGYTFSATNNAVNIYAQETGGGATLGIYEISAATSDDITITPAAGNSVLTSISCIIGGPWPPLFPAVYTGTGNISNKVGLDEAWTLCFVRVHFSGGSGNADFAVSLDSTLNAAYDTTLYTVVQAGTSKEVNFRLGTSESGYPSAWSFLSGDLLNFTWTNPDSGNITWGMSVGMVPTSLLDLWA